MKWPQLPQALPWIVFLIAYFNVGMLWSQAETSVELPIENQLTQALLSAIEQEDWGQALQITAILEHLYPSRQTVWEEYQNLLQQHLNIQSQVRQHQTLMHDLVNLDDTIKPFTHSQTHQPIEHQPKPTMDQLMDQRSDPGHKPLRGELGFSTPSFSRPPFSNPALDSQHLVSAPPLMLPLLEAPFTGTFELTNGFDHHQPQLIQDPGHFITVAGEIRVPGLEESCAKSDGHAGYDWAMPEGTPILAAASGKVILARSEPNTYCPLLDQDRQGLTVKLRHRVGELWFETLYAHLSHLSIIEGDWIQAGDLIGYSGNSGCSTGPHLHFEVRRFSSRLNQFRPVDPYGWLGVDPDPLIDSGLESLWMWKAGQSPPVTACLSSQHSTVKP